MSPTLCTIVALLVMALGGGAIYVGLRDPGGSMIAKTGGSFIFVIGILGLIACLTLN